MAYIANYLQSREKHQKLSAAFQKFDSNGDGVLQRQELIDGFVKVGLSAESALETVDEIMEKIDINRNGSIDYAEFLMANLTKEEALSESKLREAFKMFDKVTHLLNRHRMAMGR